MVTTRFTERRQGWGGWVLLAAAWAALGVSSPATAQPTLRLSDDPAGKGSDLLSQADLFLRPNVTQPVYLFVDNPGGKQTAVVVRLLAGQNPVAEVKEMVAKGKRIDLPKSAANAPPQSLTGPLELVLLDGKGKTLDKKTIRVKILEPREYLTTPVASFQSANRLATNRWSVRLQAKKGIFIGPPAKVQLVFSPERIPGLLSPEPAGGVLNNDVTATGQPVELFATNLHFRPGTDSNGSVLVNVDNYRRAFIFNTHFIPSGKPTPELVTRRNLHLSVPAYARPGATTTPVEVDYPLREPVTVELGFDKTGKKGAYQIVKFSGARQERISLSHPEGHLVFKTEVSDWSHQWDTSGITGECRFRARLLDQQNRPISFVESGQPVDAVFASVTFLNHKPNGVQLGRLPAEVPQGTPALTVTAGSSDPPEQIAGAYFFIGTPPKPEAGAKPGAKQEEKPPEGAVRAARVVDRNGTTRWQAPLKIPADKPGSFPISVQMINQIGMSTFVDTAQVKVVPPPPPATTGTIVGRVVKGTNAIGQPNLTVILWDKNKKQAAETQTDAKGNYEFKDVAPGSYQITSEDASDMVKGSQAVTVSKGKKAMPKPIELSRLGR